MPPCGKELTRTSSAKKSGSVNGTGYDIHNVDQLTTLPNMHWNPLGKRKFGRPENTWIRSVDNEMKAAGMTWVQLRRTVQNRVR
jgi:hypothetical protein